MNGPKEFLIKWKSWFNFLKNNKKDDLFKKFEVLKNLKKSKYLRKKYLQKKNTKNLLCLDII